MTLAFEGTTYIKI